MRDPISNCLFILLFIILFLFLHHYLNESEWLNDKLQMITLTFDLKEILIYAVGITIPNLVGFAAGFLTKEAVVGPWYKSLKQPPFNPPNWVFPVVWTIMYTLMGIASVMIYRTNGDDSSWGLNNINKVPLAWYFSQLALNGLWQILFFYLEQPFIALVELIILDVLIAVTGWSFYNVSHVAGYLLLPYLLWSLFATLLNYSVWLLNYNPGNQGRNMTSYINLDKQPNLVAPPAYGSMPTFTP